jgi:hypothetical protein
MSSEAAGIPEVGQAVQIRNRLATVRAVEPYDARGQQGRLHIVEVEYLDDCRYPEAEQVLWEVEATAKILGATSLPSVDANNPDHPAALRSFVNAHRWTRLNRLRESNDIRDEPLLGVWNSAIQVHPYQLEAVTEADRLRLRVEIDALCADLYGLDPDDFDWIVRDDPKDPNGFYRVDRQLPFRERLTGLAAAAFRALKAGNWSAETAGQLTNDQFFDLLGIPELTSTWKSHSAPANRWPPICIYHAKKETGVPESKSTAPDCSSIFPTTGDRLESKSRFRRWSPSRRSTRFSKPTGWIESTKPN